MQTESYKFDVAFSFLAEDEPLATQINDRIQDRVNTFLYSQRQRELAGTDGEKTFNDVFGKQARTVVVLYRSNWGKTPWTRIEETAIRGRAYEHGHPSFPGIVSIKEPKKLYGARFTFDLVVKNQPRWVSCGPQTRSFTTSEVATLLLKLIMEKGEPARKRK